MPTHSVLYGLNGMPWYSGSLSDVMLNKMQLNLKVLLNSRERFCHVFSFSKDVEHTITVHGRALLKKSLTS